MHLRPIRNLPSNAELEASHMSHFQRPAVSNYNSLMPNPFQSPTSPAEELEKHQGKFAWGKGAAMGVFTWGMVSIAAWIRFGRLWVVTQEVPAYEFYIYALLLGPLCFMDVTPNSVTAGWWLHKLQLLSGIVSHAFFWTVVLMWRRRRR